MQQPTITISVFRTNVNNRQVSRQLVEAICSLDAVVACNFDLDDCDRILRVKREIGNVKDIIGVLKTRGFECVELAD